MGLSDNEVKKQIEHMMAFIHQEAKEKADEIDAKAEEEFNIEKGRLVQQERLKIMSYFERKDKQIDLQMKIQRSNFLNQARIRLLKFQDDNIQGILDEARQRLGNVTRDKAKYKGVLEGLITQGLFQLLEPEVTIRCRKADKDLVQKTLAPTTNIYKESTGKDCKLRIDEDYYLGEDCSGGIELIAREGAVKISNTLESRLELLSRQMLPEIRVRLFGESKNRKFYN